MNLVNVLFRSPPSLHRRVTNSIFVLTAAFFLLFSAATFFLVYALEDGVYQDQLTLASKAYAKGESLPANTLFTQNLNSFSDQRGWPLLSLEKNQSNSYGEFTANQRHYHYLKVDDGYLLLDSTENSIVRRALDDIVVLLFVVFIVALACTFWVAQLTSRHALKPFQQLSQLFLTGQSNSATISHQLATISELDIKRIATELVTALEQKEQTLQQQVQFSQGMAHELRTPLQVMTHSLELLENTQANLKQTPAFSRLRTSVERMHRISTALLWLTSNQVFTGQINIEVTLTQCLSSLDQQMHSHAITPKVSLSQTCEITLPVEVLELIVQNLLNNVIHHTPRVPGQRLWSIHVCKTALSFSNPVIGQSGQSETMERFGLGLILVEKLANRFAITCHCQTLNNQFTVTLSKNR